MSRELTGCELTETRSGNPPVDDGHSTRSTPNPVNPNDNP